MLYLYKFRSNQKLQQEKLILPFESMDFKNWIFFVKKFKYTNISWLQFSFTCKQRPASREPAMCIKGLQTVNNFTFQDFSPSCSVTLLLVHNNAFQIWYNLHNKIMLLPELKQNWGLNECICFMFNLTLPVFCHMNKLYENSEKRTVWKEISCHFLCSSFHWPIQRWSSFRRLLTCGMHTSS